MARRCCDEIFIIDLGGDRKGAVQDENVFGLTTPVAVVLMVGKGRKRGENQARVRYRRIAAGSADAKLEAFASLCAAPELLESGWTPVEGKDTAHLLPATRNTRWSSFVGVSRIFPWSQPGCMVNRTWPISVSRELLEQRWRRFA